MKKVLILALAVCAAACLHPIPARAQIVPIVPEITGKLGMSQGDNFCPNISGKPITNHNFVYSTHFAPSALLITITTSTGGAFTANTTASTVAGGTIVVNGSFTGICFTVTTLTGTNASVDGSYFGPGLGSGGTISGTISIDQTTPGTTNGVRATIAANGVAVGGIPDGAIVPLGSTTDNRCTATDTTAEGQICLLKQNNYLLNLIVTGTATSSVTDPCNGLAKTVVNINISTATTTELDDGTAAQYLYVCGLNLVTAAANNVALVSDATDVCASPDAGMAGGVTAATGWNFAANGGLILGNGNGTVMKTSATGVRVCLMTSAATQLSGTISYVKAP